MSKQTPKTEEIIDVAVDDGHAGIKLYMVANGKPLSLRLNSRVRMGIHGTTVIDHPAAGSGNDVVPGYETEGGQFTVGDFHDAETARFDDYPFSGINRVLVAHALRLAGLGGKEQEAFAGELARVDDGLDGLTGLQRQQAVGQAPGQDLVFEEAHQVAGDGGGLGARDLLGEPDVDLRQLLDRAGGCGPRSLLWSRRRRHRGREQGLHQDQIL